MTINNVDKVRARMNDGELLIGSSITFNDPAVSELFGDVGFDFTWIDMEHCPIGIEAALGHVMAVRGTPAAPFIRVPVGDPIVLKPVLELHPAAVIIPQVCSVAEVRTAVAACKYPPRGVRGFGPRRGRGFGALDNMSYLASADEQTLVFVQIEHSDAASALDDILQVEGLDGVCIGFNDLAASLGLPGQTADPRVIKVADNTIRSTLDSEKWIGISMGYDPKAIQEWIDKGVQWLSIGGDFNLLYSHARNVLEDVRSKSQRRSPRP